jgi:nucleotide-binding universal stress UspA family protein
MVMTSDREEAMTSQSTGRTVVVGYDGSSASRAAVEHAIDRALPDGRIVLVHGYQVASDFVGASYYNAMLDDARDYAVRVMDDLDHDCERLAGVAHERDLVLAPAATAITHAAELEDADEIVIGTRGVGRMRALLGSVAHDVIHHARCPVTVIPERMVATADEAPLEAAPAGA